MLVLLRADEEIIASASGGGCVVDGSSGDNNVVVNDLFLDEEEPSSSSGGSTLYREHTDVVSENVTLKVDVNFGDDDSIRVTGPGGEDVSGCLVIFGNVGPPGLRPPEKSQV